MVLMKKNYVNFFGNLKASDLIFLNFRLQTINVTVPLKALNIFLKIKKLVSS